MSRLEHVEEEKVNYDFFLDLPEIDRSKLETGLISARRSSLHRCLNIPGAHPAAVKRRY